MKHLCSCIAICFATFALTTFSASAAALPSDWQHDQSFEAAAPGLVKLSVPLETLDAARPGLEDLRVYDNAGNEVPYLIEHPVPATRIVRNAKSFQTSLNPQNTVVTLETGITQAINNVTLETPANSFIKSVSVQGSTDSRSWRSIVQSRPIFRQAGGMTELRIEIPPGTWPWLRLTVDDQKSPPIPFTGARIQAAAGASAPDEPLPVTISNRHETPGESRLTLHLGSANLTLSQIQIETPEPLFTRDVTIAVPQIKGDSIQEQSVARGTLYRVTLNDEAASQGLSLPMETQVGSRDLLLLIRNNDSPPLPITSVRALRRPVYLVFQAKEAVVHHLLTGNSRCAAPRYDLAGLANNLKTVPVAPVKFSPLTDNPGFRPPEVLAEVQDNGTALDVAAWKFRKPVKIERTGAQQLELDPDILSHAQPDFADLRLMRDGKQLPYIIERTSLRRTLNPAVTAANHSRDPELSEWILKLPHSALPVTRLICASRTPLFHRDITATEELHDERGEKYPHSLGSGSWTQKPGATNNEFTIAFDTAPQSDTIILITQNGDNPPIELENFRLYYPVTRLLFKAKSNDALSLCYGNPEVAAPHYDLNLVANELLAADKSAASLGAEEGLNKATWQVTNTSGKGGVLFWGILAAVVIVLLAVIARLLPKSDAQPPK